MPPQLPAPGQAFFSMAVSCCSSIWPPLYWPTASKALTTVRSQAPSLPGLIVPPYTKIAGMSMRAMASMAPGMFLSQPPMASSPSMLWPLQAVSIESAITSRLTREYFIPSVPMEMPSLTVIVPNSWGMAPAWCAASSARRARSFSPRLQGVIVL